MPTLGVSYHVGIDGISLLLVLLTTFLTPLALASAWGVIEDRLEGVRGRRCWSSRPGCSASS